MALTNSAVFQRFQTSKNKVLALVLSACLLTTAPASHSFFAIIFGELGVKFALSIPALVGFAYSKTRRDRDYNIMYFDAPTITKFPAETKPKNKAAVECLLEQMSNLSANSKGAEQLVGIEGKSYELEPISEAPLSEAQKSSVNGATIRGQSTIWINQEAIASSTIIMGSEELRYMNTVLHELVHQSSDLADPHAYRGKSSSEYYLDPDYWNTSFGRELKDAWQNIFSEPHPYYKKANHPYLANTLLSLSNPCFGGLLRDDRPPAPGEYYR